MCMIALSVHFICGIKKEKQVHAIFYFCLPIFNYF